MNDREAAKFASTIKKQAWHQVRVKRGRTNGQHCFHIFDTEAKDRRRASTTIYTEGEWLVHPLNSINRPTRKSDERALEDWTNEFTSFTAGLQATMGRLTETAVAAAAKMADFKVGRDPEGGTT
jgi:type 1 glutamine amidotransferase